MGIKLRPRRIYCDGDIDQIPEETLWEILKIYQFGKDLPQELPDVITSPKGGWVRYSKVLAIRELMRKHI